MSWLRPLGGAQKRLVQPAVRVVRRVHQPFAHRFRVIHYEITACTGTDQQQSDPEARTDPEVRYHTQGRLMVQAQTFQGPYRPVVPSPAVP